MQTGRGLTGNIYGLSPLYTLTKAHTILPRVCELKSNSQRPVATSCGLNTHSLQALALAARGNEIWETLSKFVAGVRQLFQVTLKLLPPRDVGRKCSMHQWENRRLEFRRRQVCTFHFSPRWSLDSLKRPTSVDSLAISL